MVKRQRLEKIQGGISSVHDFMKNQDQFRQFVKRPEQYSGINDEGMNRVGRGGQLNSGSTWGRLKKKMQSFKKA